MHSNNSRVTRSNSATNYLETNLIVYLAWFNLSPLGLVRTRGLLGHGVLFELLHWRLRHDSDRSEYSSGLNRLLFLPCRDRSRLILEFDYERELASSYCQGCTLIITSMMTTNSDPIVANCIQFFSIQLLYTVLFIYHSVCEHTEQIKWNARLSIQRQFNFNEL